MKRSHWFVFDVESIGLYGEAFAVAGGIYLNGKAVDEFCCYFGSNPKPNAKDQAPAE